MVGDNPASKAFRAGKLREALALVASEKHPTSETALRAYLYYLTGETARATASAQKLLTIPELESTQRSLCVSVLSLCEKDQGHRANALGLARRALDAAIKGGNFSRMCLAAAEVLVLSCEKQFFDASVPLAAQTRQYAIRSGDPQVLAETHLTFARLEARAGHHDAALRHIDIAKDLLATDPNLRLAAIACFDEAGVRWLLGDFEESRRLTYAGLATSQTAGWAQGIAAGSINVPFLSVAVGEFDEARQEIQRAEREASAVQDYVLGLVETKARLEMSCGNFSAAEQLLNTPANGDVTASPWFSLFIGDTKTHLLALERRWNEAFDTANDYLKLAEETGIESLRQTLKLRRAEALIALQQSVRPADLSLGDDRSDWPPESTAHFYLALGEALVSSGHMERGTAALLRAERLFRQVANPLRQQQLGAMRERFPLEGPSVGARTDLDSAVALLDLAGYPHILAREAYAILKDSGAVQAIAVLAVGRTATRIIEVEGWTERQAIEAAGGTAGIEKMMAGTHRDEMWQVIAQPREGLDEHCTVVAVRKLVAAAASLDRYRRDEKQRAALWPAEALEGDPDSIWASEQTAEILGIARRIAPTPLSVLLTGETGTGKEMLARAIHRASDRADKPFLPFNCTAVPRDMLESQLFGYRRGAFTGADASFAGIIRSAAGGTLFLDEIAEVGPELQPKLLRFLETHEIHPLGEPQPMKVDVRVIAATNRDLEQLVAEGRFREDLFYRLNVIRLTLPPLRERREEIPPLVQHYLRRYSDEQKKGTLTLADETLEYLLLYSWPGNVRQLANEVRRMVALSERDATLTPAQLSPEIQASRRTIAVPAGGEPEIRVRLEQPLPAAVELLEKSMVRHALNRAHGRVEEASRLLGISRKGLFLKRKRWGLQQAS